MNIVLTGFMASGKSTVGKRLAEINGMRFVDTDELIENENNMKISDIFAEYGEKYFRKLEEETAKKLSETDYAVISTGGGFTVNKNNIAYLRKNGTIVNLNPTLEIILKRLTSESDSRPLAKDKNRLIELFEMRKPFYDDCDIRIDIIEEESAEETAKKILSQIEKRRKSV